MPGVVHLPINGNFDAGHAMRVKAASVEMGFFGIDIRRLAVISPIGLAAHLIEVESVTTRLSSGVRVDVEDISRGVHSGVAASRQYMGGSIARSRSSSGDTSVSTTLSQGATNRQDDTERHCRGEHSGHAGHSRLDRIRGVGRRNNEPEEHVDHVDQPDRGVEIEAITEHELPGTKGLDLQGLDGTSQSQCPGSSEEYGGCKPVDTDPVRDGASNAALCLFEGHDSVEGARNCHCGNLCQQENPEAEEDGSRLVVDSMNADKMDNRASRNENHGCDRFKQVEAPTHRKGEVCTEEGHRNYYELGWHQVPQDLEKYLEGRPFRRLGEPPSTGGKNESVPCGDRQGAHEEILVGRKMGR